ncbi:hypothetical protein CR513_48027, partial [Mucuna pruriens]
MALSECDIVYMNQKAINGSTLVEHLAYHPIVDYQPLLHEFPNEHIMAIAQTELESDGWTMWFDGASNLLRNEIGAVLASPKDQCFIIIGQTRDHLPSRLEGGKLDGRCPCNLVGHGVSE